ncbi:MAG: hypothetical protein J7527_09470, partial [Chitinophagaceae bacterium]|nr:hypothetical protein [Chitinophagaceae bacterium]
MLKEQKRFETLDTLRGLASLQVVISHALYITPLIERIHHAKTTEGLSLPVIVFSFTPVHTIWAASEAVILFFVLSGYVLS